MSIGIRSSAPATEGSGQPVSRRRVRVSRSARDRLPEAGRTRRLDLWSFGGLIVTAAGLAVALVVALQESQVLGFGDSVSHVLIPTRVFKGYDVGFRQLGVHWLPLAHVLQLPFSWIEPLYQHGISGVVVSVVASLLTAFYLYRLARLVGASGPVAFAATLMLAASPSFLYMGVVPMLSATVMASTTANIYYLTRWALAPERTRLLVLAGLTLSVATLSHLDTWPLVPLELSIVAIVVHRRWRSRVRTIASLGLAALAGTYGIAAYLVMNVLIFGDPLAFLRDGLGLSGEAGVALSPLKGLAGLAAHPWSVWENAGPALAVVGLLGTVLYAWRRRAEPRFLVPLLLFYPVAWYAFQAATVGSFILPSADPLLFLHLRYGVTVLPALAFFGALGFRRRPLALLAVVAALAGAWSMVDHDRVATWRDAKNEAGGVIDDALRPAARALGDHMGEGLVYVPVVEQYNDRFELLTGQPPSRFLDASASDWRRLRRDPSLARRYGAAYILKVGVADPALLDTVLRATNAELCLSLPRNGMAPSVQIYTLTGSCPTMSSTPAAAPTGSSSRSSLSRPLGILGGLTLALFTAAIVRRLFRRRRAPSQVQRQGTSVPTAPKPTREPRTRDGAQASDAEQSGGAQKPVTAPGSRTTRPAAGAVPALRTRDRPSAAEIPDARGPATVLDAQPGPPMPSRHPPTIAQLLEGGPQVPRPESGAPEESDAAALGRPVPKAEHQGAPGPTRSSEARSTPPEAPVGAAPPPPAVVPTAPADEVWSWVIAEELLPPQDIDLPAYWLGGRLVLPDGLDSVAGRRRDPPVADEPTQHPHDRDGREA
ncbi:MAG: hypothetical protein ACR2KK_05450 [Acidimicrobiales bacterium]